MLDDRLTQDIRLWLDSPQEQRSLEQGAEMLLRLNRNRYMHAQILRRRNFAKLEYELQKHLRIRLEGLTTREVALMEQEALPKIEESLAKDVHPDCRRFSVLSRSQTARRSRATPRI